MSGKQPVDPYGIPVFTGSLVVLDQQVTALAKDGAAIATATGDVHSSFGGLQAFYKAPEADQLFATTKPVADRGAALKSDLATITGALSAYADDAQPLVAKLERLKEEASAFQDKARADDKWHEDGDLIEENRRRHDEIIEAWTAFQAVERACYNKIIALVPTGEPLKTNDGSGGQHMHGYDAEALKQAKGLPWGDPVKETTRWYQFYEHVWDFGKGFVVDGVWGTVKGLGTLVGTDGWDSMKQAWTGLGNLTTGVILTVAAPHALWLTPEKDLPGFARDARNAMKETGKALIAYDQWGENPARAGGAVTFNVLTTVFTGGAGGGASGAGKAAAAAKALSFANKASRVVDPTAYLFKGAGAGLTKISDVMAGLKGTGNIEIPPLPAGTIALPDGAYKAADGTLTLPEGAAVPEAAFEIPKGSVKLPDGAEIPTGAIDLGDGIVRLPEGMAPPAGSLPIQEGTLKLPEGTTALPENAVELTTPDGKTVYVDREGSILAADGTLKQHHTDAPQGNPPTGASTRTDADSPLPRTPAEQSALVGAGARGGSDTVRLGSDLSDAGRIGDDLGRTGDDAPNPDRAPGGTANNVPTNSVDNSTHGGGSRGDQGGHIPANSLDGGNPTGAGGRDVHGGSGTNPSGGGTAPHGDSNTTGSDSGVSGVPHQGGSGGHDAPGSSDGSNPDNAPNSPPRDAGVQHMDPKVVDERIKELDDRQGGQGHAPGRHLHPDDQALTDRLGTVLRDSNGVPKLYGPNSNYPGLVKSENNIDPLTGTAVDGVTGRAHRVGAFATRFDNAEDMARADAYFRAEMARTGEEAIETSIEDVLGPGAEERFTGYYRDPANLDEFKPVNFEGGTIMPLYRQNPDGTYRLHTMFANPAPGRHP
ncbi:hypothetical protein AB0D92_13655 [Streptomyces parvus]|uniref:hypothetical protein n=1 Tax=Streptomyces parvus TaxID=66428 RepID=UPI0033E13B5A